MSADSGAYPACEWCGRAILPDHDGRWLTAKPPHEPNCDASDDGWHSPPARTDSGPTS